MQKVKIVTEKSELVSPYMDKLTFVRGIKSGLSIAVGYIPIAITFGLLAKSSNIPNYASLLMSLIVFAGASQFIGVQLIIIGSSYWEIILTTFILNFRHFLMSSSLSHKIEKNVPRFLLSILAFGITDETFALASTRKEETLSAYYILGLNSIAFFSWNVGTWIGIFAGNILPTSVSSSMGIALYCMFIALLIPSVTTAKPTLLVALIAMFTHSLLRWLPYVRTLSTGLTIIISTMFASMLGAILFPENKE